MRLLALLALAALPTAAPLAAQGGPPLMPLPAHLELGAARLRLDSTFFATIARFRDPRLQRGVSRALSRLGARIAQPVATTPRAGGDSAGAGLLVEVAGPGLAVQTPDEDESYRLAIDDRRARLAAPTVVGALRGLETLLQLVSADSAGFYLPAARIADAPRFRWRGLLVDASRHFMPPEVIRRTLDGMAVVKLNVLHWHLSDDQGFRVESRRYPRLQQEGSDGLFYTQQEIRQIVVYARDRGIRVVPEFDMPGHSTSWFVGYPAYAGAPGPYQIERRFGVFDPTFDPTREQTYRFIDGFVAEMAALFPDPYWHIGGDEVKGKQWNQNPRILRFKRQHGFKDNAALQAYFNQRLSRILSRHGKRMVGWDEILHPDLSRDAVVQSWRGTEYLGRATARGHPALLSAPYYLDHIDTAEEHYLADPLPPGSLPPEQAALVLGGEACMWAENVGPETVDSRLWPRLAAIAERFWSPGSVRDVDDMYRRLAAVSIQLERAGLGHEGHTSRMLRLLTGRLDIPPLADLLAAVMPVTFGQRSRLQGPTQLTPLTRLVDAARPDPWARSRLLALARAAAADPAEAQAARDELVAQFAAWRPLDDQIMPLADSLPLAAEGVPAAVALHRLAGLGLQALDYLAKGTAPAGWRAQADSALDSLAAPQGLLRLAATDAVRVLVDSGRVSGER
jgi:hexosaminidase